MTAYSGTTWPPPAPGEDIFGDSAQGAIWAPSGGSVAQYRMRGIVAGNFVYWWATIIDSTGSQYTGGGGPPTGIVYLYSTT